jgi:hypothetical protein
MQVDMHYGATSVLARAAGFDEPDALTIGYAAQYVDDAQDGRDISVAGQTFSPLATANSLGGYLHSRQKETWLKVYLPFHFLPPGPIRSPEGDFITQAGGEMVRKLLADVAQDPGPEPRYRLCRLGVALHTVADTWSHQGFSGRWHPENDVVQLEPLDTPPSLAKAMEQAFRDWLDLIAVATPMYVAHFQAGFLPDYPFLSWRAVFDQLPGQASGRSLSLDNQEQYLTASEFIYQTLCDWPKDQPSAVTAWEDILPGIKRCLAHTGVDRQARCDQWRAEFGWLFPLSGGMPAYDVHAWEVEALGEKLQQDVVDDLLQLVGIHHHYPGTPGFPQSRWVRFHQAAARQRAWLGQQVKI